MFSIAAVTNDHKRSGKNNTNVFILQFWWTEVSLWSHQAPFLLEIPAENPFPAFSRFWRPPSSPYPTPSPALSGWWPHLHCLVHRVAFLILLLPHFPLTTAGKLLAFKDLNIRLGPPRIAFPSQGCNLNHIYRVSFAR